MANTHLASLSAKHAALDSSLTQEMLRPMPDQTVLAQLKKAKLRLKEEIVRETAH
jgi:hypothetical protein